MAALLLAACDQVSIVEPDATWAGSMGYIVANGGDPSAIEFVQRDGAGSEQGRMTIVAIDKARPDKAARLETLGQPPHMESLQARVVTKADITAGDACWLSFDARAVQPQVELGLGRLSIMVRPEVSDGEPWLHRSIYLEPGWTSVDLAFNAPEDLDAGEGAVVFGIGTQLQVLDLAAISMRCFDDGRALARLPSSSFSYGGREPDAPWRATAESQIERYRKGDLTVEVIDASGEPVPDVEIHIQMSRHAFSFGAMIDPDQLAGIGENANQEAKTASYRNNLKQLFNTVGFDDELRWTAWANPDRRQNTEIALAWVRSLGLDLRGHGLVSTKSDDLPPALDEQRGEPDAIREAVRAGVAATASGLEGRVTAWDVVSQPRENHDLLDLVGWEELATWFRLTRSAAPDTKLVLSESDILAGDRMAELAALVGNLIADDVPVDRIGVQGQFGAQPPPIQALSDRLDQLASFDLPLIITAFDMSTADERLQQDFTRDFLTLAFSHPSVEGFIFGRFWEDEDAPGGGVALYRSDGTITPIGNIYRDLVLRDWWTDVVALSNVEGVLTSRVFQGDYMISAQKDDQVASVTLNLGADGTKVTLTLAAEDQDDRAL